PASARLAEPSATIVRSIRSAPYAISKTSEERATVQAELYQHQKSGSVLVELSGAKPAEFHLEPGLQRIEIPAHPSKNGKATAIRLSAGGRVLYSTELSLTNSPRATPSDYVDIFKGTQHSRWMIAPGPWMPFGMVKISPDNQTQGWIAGYEYSHEFIDCFSHIHEWTMAGLGMMPTLGPLRTAPGLDGTGYSSRFDKTSERGGIGFYEVLLKDTGIRVELTAT